MSPIKGISKNIMNKPYMSLAIVILFTLFFSACSKRDNNKKINETKKVAKVEKKDPKKELALAEKEYSEIDTVAYLEKYIEKVIKEGSTGLGFPGGDMDPGFALPDDAKKIARYVMLLSGKKIDNPEEAKKASLFYTSNCGGCHGDDGKGLNGSFPDLTRPTLLGVEIRKRDLEIKIETLKQKLSKK